MKAPNKAVKNPSCNDGCLAVNEGTAETILEFQGGIHLAQAASYYYNRFITNELLWSSGSGQGKDTSGFLSGGTKVPNLFIQSAIDPTAYRGPDFSLIGTFRF